MNTPAKTADRSAPKSGSEILRLTNAERDWMRSLDASELTVCLNRMPPTARATLLAELRDHRKARLMSASTRLSPCQNQIKSRSGFKTVV